MLFEHLLIPTPHRSSENNLMMDLGKKMNQTANTANAMGKLELPHTINNKIVDQNIMNDYRCFRSATDTLRRTIMSITER